MATLRFLLKRFAAQRLLGLAVVVTLAFTVGVLVAGPIYADAAREAILSSSLASESVTVRNARLQVFGGPSFDWQAADDSIIERALGRAAGDPGAAGARHRPPRRDRRSFGAVAVPGGRGATSHDRRSAARRGGDRPAGEHGTDRGRRGGRLGRDRGTERRRRDAADLGHVRTRRPRRSVLVRQPEPVPGPRFHRPTAHARRPGHVPRCRPPTRSHERVRVGCIPRAGRRAFRPSLARAGGAVAHRGQPCGPRPVSSPRGSRAASARCSTSWTCG